MFPKLTITAVVAIVAASLTGCGSTSGGGAASGTQQPLAGQICGQQTAAKPDDKSAQRRVAAANALALTLQGEREVSIYDGSLEEWAADPTLPLELGR